MPVRKSVRIGLPLLLLLLVLAAGLIFLRMSWRRQSPLDELSPVTDSMDGSREDESLENPQKPKEDVEGKPGTGDENREASPPQAVPPGHGAVRGVVVDRLKKPIPFPTVAVQTTLRFSNEPSVRDGWDLVRHATPEKILVETRGDGAGCFFLTLPVEKDGDFSLRASAPGFATGFVQGIKWKAGDEGELFEVVLGPGASAFGGVVDESDQPIEGALVIARRIRDQEEISRARLLGESFIEKLWKRTGKDGSFRFGDLTRCQYQFTAIKSGRAQASKTVQVPSAEEIVIVLPGGFLLCGRVVEKVSKNPIPGARIMVKRKGEGASFKRAETDAQGEFRLEQLHPGKQKVWVWARGYGRIYLVLDGTSGRTVREDFSLPCGVTVSGVVLDTATRAPIPGARIVAYTGWYQDSFGGLVESVSGPDGAFRLEGVYAVSMQGFGGPEKLFFYLTASKPGWQTAPVREGDIIVQPIHVAVPVGASRADRQEYGMVKRPRAFGRVVDESGLPVSGVKVTALVLHPGYFKMVSGEKPMPAHSDDEGNFAVELNFPGTDLIWFEHPRHGFAYHRFKYLLSPGEEKRDLEIRMPSTGSIKGTVEDEEGKPVTGERVRCRYLGEEEKAKRYWKSRIHYLAPVARGAQFEIRTDAKGVFSFPRLRPGLWEVSVTSEKSPIPQASRIVVVSGAETKAHIKFSPPLTIEGIVVDESGTPLEGARIAAFPKWTDTGGQTVSGPDGTFKFENLAPDDYYVNTSLEGFGRDHLEGVKAGTTNLRIVLKKE